MKIKETVVEFPDKMVKVSVNELGRNKGFLVMTFAYAKNDPAESILSEEYCEFGEETKKAYEEKLKLLSFLGGEIKEK